MTNDRGSRPTGRLTREEFDALLDKLSQTLPPHLEAREISALITAIFGIYNVPPAKAIIMMDNLLGIYLEHVKPDKERMH